MKVGFGRLAHSASFIEPSGLPGEGGLVKNIAFASLSNSLAG